MNANIQIFNANINEIYDNIKNIIIRQTIRIATKKTIMTIITITIFEVFAIIKTIIKKIIQVSDDNDDDFNANDKDNVNSNND